MPALASQYVGGRTVHLESIDYVIMVTVMNSNRVAGRKTRARKKVIRQLPKRVMAENKFVFETQYEGALLYLGDRQDT